MAYTNNLNKALDMMRKKGYAFLKNCNAVEHLLYQLNNIEQADIKTMVRNNGGGYANHNLFWKMMVPEKRFTRTKNIMCA